MNEPMLTDGRKPKRNRGWVKNAIIIFLAIMLVLTFFSNTIMNYSLPEVSAQYPVSTTVTTKIRGTGTVEAAKSYNVTVMESRTVATVNVKVGDTIAAGDTLLTLDETESEELQAARTNYNNLLLEYNKMLLTNDSGGNADSYALSQAEAAVTAAENDLAAARTYENGLATYQASEDAAYSALTAKQNEQATAQATVDSLQEQITNAPNANADYLAACNTYGADSEEAIAIYNEKIAPTIASLTAKLTTAQTDLANATAAVTTASNNYSAAQTAKANYQAEHSGVSSVDAAQAALTAAQSALASLQASNADAAAEAEYNAQVAALDLEAKKADLDAAEALVAELEAKTAATAIVSRYPGVVTAVNIAAGDTTSTESPLITVDLTQQGYTLKASITKDQAKLLRVGMNAEITNLWNSDIVMTLTGIATDSSNPGSGRTLTFNLTGEDVNVGDTISFSVGDKNTSYDVVVPTAAIHTDADGSFVYTVSVKSSPLGNRYTVKKMTVSVIAADESNSAVTGELSTADFVIVTSATPLSVGDQIRIAE